MVYSPTKGGGMVATIPAPKAIIEMVSPKQKYWAIDWFWGPGAQEELAQAQKEYNEANKALKGLIPYIKSKGESTQDYLNEIGNNPVNVGEQGYASMTENQEFQIGTWIDTGFLKGSKEIIYDKEKGWGTKYKELDDKETGVDNKEFIIWGTQAANYTTTKVPTVDKTLENVLECHTSPRAHRVCF